MTHALIAPYGAFTSRDGSAVLISIQSNREWQVFCRQVLHQPQLASDPKFADNADRVAQRENLQKIIDTAFSNYDREELILMLNENGIACGQLSSVNDLSEHRFLRNVDAQFGDINIVMADLPVQTDQPRPERVPQLGEHTSAIRLEFAQANSINNDKNT